MTRCVIDSDGLFVEEQYFDDGRQSIEAEVPRLKPNQAAKWNGEGWEIVADYRGSIVIIGNTDCIWDKLGYLPDGAVVL